MIVAIDGPAGAGKGAIAKMISERLGFTRIDTGAMYRCVTLKMIRLNIGLSEIDKIKDLLEHTDIRLSIEDDILKVYLDGEDVTKEIRTPEVNDFVSPVSAIKEIRIKMVDLQRNMKNYAKDIVMEGRDITTVVFPDADFKFYLTASSEKRAERRLKEMQEAGVEITYEEVLNSIVARDKKDMEKEMGALMVAKDAIIIDNTEMDLEETFEAFKKEIEKSRGE